MLILFRLKKEMLVNMLFRIVIKSFVKFDGIWVIIREFILVLNSDFLSLVDKVG